MKPQEITLCMIAKNEEHNIASALRSVLDLVDEIIVVDTGSTDRTKQIAASLGANVFDFEWCNDFSAARNFSLSKATCPWILVLDADETISSKDHSRIKELLKEDRFFGFELIQRNYVTDGSINGTVPCGDEYDEERGYTAFLPVPIVRLFRNDPRIKFQGYVHEVVSDSLKDHDLPVKQTDIPIHHHGYAATGNTGSKLKFYYELGKEKLKKRKGDFKAYYELGVNCALRGDQDQALELLKKSVSLNPRFHQSQMMLGTVYMNKGQLEPAIGHLKKALELAPRDFGALNNLGKIYRRLGKTKKALSCLSEAHQINPNNAAVLHNLGLVYKDMWEYEKAEKVFSKALGLPEPNKDTLIELAEIYCITGREKEARDLLVRATKQGVASPRASNILNALDRPPKTISLCMIVKDEEENLRRLLPPVKNLFEEIIIVDTGSSDQSGQVATALGAKVFHFEWCDDFSAARNYSLSKTKCDYIFWMDADDRMDPININRFRALKWKLRSEDKPLALFFTVVSNVGSVGQESVFQQLRLFANIEGVKFEGRLHEQVFPSLNRLGVAFRAVEISIFHTGYDDPGKRVDKVKRNLKILEKEQDNPFSCIHRAGLLKSLGRRAEARSALEQALEYKQIIKPYTGWFEKAVSSLAEIHIEDGEYLLARDILLAGLNESPDSFRLLVMAGDVMLKLNNPREALSFLKRAVSVPLSPGPVPMRISLEKSKAYLLLGHCYRELGQFSDALNAYKHSLFHMNNNLEAIDAIRKLSLLFEECGEFLGGLEAMESIPAPLEIHDQVTAMCYALLSAQQEKFAHYAESILTRLGLPTDLEINSLRDLASLLSTIAGHLPPSPLTSATIKRLHNTLASLMSTGRNTNKVACLSN